MAHDWLFNPDVHNAPLASGCTDPKRVRAGVCDACLTPSTCNPHGAFLRCADRAHTTQETTPTMPDRIAELHGLVLTEDSDDRKNTPMCTGVLDYFPAALAYVARVSKFGNDKHNPGAPRLMWSRGKSADHADTILRHLADRGLQDSDGIRHSGYVAWRALAMLQQELEDEGATPGRASAFAEAHTACGTEACCGGCADAVPPSSYSEPQPDMVGDGRLNGLALHGVVQHLERVLEPTAFARKADAEAAGMVCGIAVRDADKGRAWLLTGCFREPCCNAGGGCPGPKHRSELDAVLESAR